MLLFYATKKEHWLAIKIFPPNQCSFFYIAPTPKGNGIGSKLYMLKA